MIQLNKNFQRKILIIFLSISFNICFGYSKEPSHWNGSFEYPQHMFWFINKKKKIQLHSLISGLVGPTGVYLLDFFCSRIQFYLLLSPYLCFISFLYLDLYVLGDDALIS